MKFWVGKSGFCNRLRAPNSQKGKEEKDENKIWKIGGMIVLALVMIVAGCAGTQKNAGSVEEQGTVDKALVTYRDFMADKEMDWFRDNLKDAKAILIVPNLLKAGFILGGSGGSGVLVARDEKTGDWSQPAFYTVASVTFGLQIGGESAEVIMMIRTQKALDALFTADFKLGGDTSVAAGPVGIGAKGTVTTDIVSFAKSKGLFAGLNLEGSMVKVSDSSNKAYYDKAASPLDIIVKKAVSNPGSDKLREELKKAIK
jgi:SH3 domain-containing YSC84-like protein 1